MAGGAVFPQTEITLALESAIDLKLLLDRGGQLREGRNKRIRLDLGQEEASGQSPGLADCLLDKPNGFAGFNRLFDMTSLQPVRQQLYRQGRAGEILANPSLQVMSDAAPFALADFEHRFFQALAFGDFLGQRRSPLPDPILQLALACKQLPIGGFQGASSQTTTR